ncbi:DUF1440 domain-containing protein [Sinomonas terrae]|uniref:DUF1440 domain-containing protein n=1 Tax=Sinomonas terrae TaxID=2908838 RepID=A0ABS9U6K9_9MICC|nr:DUF1440 domain-containing protein [Sinomonas terrae]MCH6472342.1 DUF1440 domain-containing protein [Sinomonas terrae]
MGLIRRAIRGASAGVAATAAMTTVFGAAGASGLIHRQPPEKIVRTLFPSLPTTGKEALALASHVGYGMSGGALYSCLVPFRFQDPGTGTVFGAMVWLAGYEGWLPAMDILPPAHEDRPGRAANVFIAHLVYGWTLGWAARRLREKRESKNPA